MNLISDTVLRVEVIVIQYRSGATHSAVIRPVIALCSHLVNIIRFYIRQITLFLKFNTEWFVKGNTIAIIHINHTSIIFKAIYNALTIQLLVINSYYKNACWVFIYNYR